jgi:hypothetical protein
METPTVAAGVSPADANASPNDELITIAGGVDLEVTKQDGSKETVKVRQIPISKIDFGTAVGSGDEASAIALYCDKPKEWVDALDLQSLNAVADKGQELNLPFYGAWFRRQVKWRENETPGAIVELEKRVTQMIAGLRSGNSQQSSPTTTS